ncbi:MAG: cysteine desulfurase-like protein [Chloroflexi bacterium]|nr:cysteine desulfurase-like protein [Chloroflexota bacterium]
MPTLDIAWIRAQFPALAQEVHGRQAVFFDGPGGTQVPQRVIDAVADYLAHHNANTHGAFATSQRSDAIIDSAHAAMADLLGCDANEVVFGPNMTTLTFAISRAIGRELRPGDEIVLTRLDHDANVAPWKALEEQGAVIRMVDVDIEDCTLDMADMARAIGPRTKLVAVGYASNAVGTINDVASITRMAHDAGAMVYIDAVHYAPHGPIDVRGLDCDFLACSPYKFFAPHMGAVYGKREHLERLRPYKVRPASDAIPDRWETGTRNHEGLAGVGAAIEYLAELGRQDAPALSRREALLRAMSAIRVYERELSQKLIAGLLAIPGLSFYGITDPARFDRRTPTVAVRMEGHTPRALAEYLGERGIFCWDGNYYALNLTERLGVEASGGMLRIGLVHYNTAEEIDRLLTVLGELA